VPQGRPTPRPTGGDGEADGAQRSRFSELQGDYWSAAEFRPAEHPTVVAYAEPKVAFLDRQGPLTGRSVLDVGCGNGIFTLPLARIAAGVVGVDLHANMLRANPHPVRVQGSAFDLPFAEGAFEVVFAANLLHHVDQPQRVLAELCRCSSRQLMLVEPNRWNPLMLGFGLLVRAERGLLRSSRRALTRWVAAAGFRVTAAITCGMISQNNTPSFLVPWLKRFDGETWLGEYVVLCAERPR
jgi:SAM-dependent methyltransferase